MNNLTIINKDATVRVIEVSRTSLSQFVGQLITQALLVAGFSVNDKAMAVMLEEVPKDIHQNFKLLEVPEISQAFYEGVRGHYGEYYGITTITIHKWLKAYVDAGKHQQYLAKKPVPADQKALPEKTEKTQEEIDEIMKNGIVYWFEVYRSTGNLLDAGSPKYDWLYTHGILLPEDDQIQSYLAAAKDEVYKEISVKAASLSRIERLSAVSELKTFETQGDYNSKVQSYAKLYALIDFFDSLISDNKEIIDLIS